MLPEHMDNWSRNRRLYDTLKGMGLYVTPIFADAEAALIDRLIVAASVPTNRTENLSEKGVVAQSDVVSPVHRLKVDDVVRPSARAGDNVVKLPTER